MSQAAPFVDTLSEIEVRRPAGGLSDTQHIDLVRPEDASASVNVHYDRLCIEKRQGRVQIGQTLTTHTRCDWLWHYRKKDGTQAVLAVFANTGTGNGYLYKLDTADTSGSAWGTWKGAVSAATTATVADLFCNGNRLGTAVQYAQRIHYADGGTLKKMFDLTEIKDWGVLLTTLAGLAMAIIASKA